MFSHMDCYFWFKRQLFHPTFIIEMVANVGVSWQQAAVSKLKKEVSHRS